MSRNLKELNGFLDSLETHLPRLIADHPDDGDFWAAFAGEADIIENAAGDHGAHVRGRIDRMLASHGLIPSDIDGSEEDGA